jgi:putative ubiquitin-RnfH superfamily antitoxin RatB of RatAB toxin-antitoxin module
VSAAAGPADPPGDGPVAPGDVHVTIVYALPDRQYAVELDLPRGARIADALASVSALPPFAELDLETLPVGIYGEPVERTRVLVDHDRVELYRPLLVDPADARRQRSRVR